MAEVLVLRQGDDSGGRGRHRPVHARTERTTATERAIVVARAGEGGEGDARPDLGFEDHQAIGS